jgi:hypothetical protein
MFRSSEAIIAQNSFPAFMADQCIAAFRFNREVGQPATIKFRGSRSREELLNDRNSYVGELFVGRSSTAARKFARRRSVMDGIIYLVGLIVIIMFILSFLGLH